MNEVRLYKNPYPYPQYGGISLYKTIQATPRNQNLKSGYIDVQLTMDEIMNFNYIGMLGWANFIRMGYRRGNLIRKIGCLGFTMMLTVLEPTKTILSLESNTLKGP